MKTSAVPAAVFAMMSAPAFGQVGSDALSACSLPSYAERMRCLEKLAGGPPAPPQVAATPAAGPAPAEAAAPTAAVAPTHTPTPAPAAVPAPEPATAPAPVAAPAVARPLAKAAPAAPPPSGQWIVSETRSPVDYSPVAIATASSSGGSNGVLQLSIQCRGGRSEMVVRGAPPMPRAEDHVVSYTIDDAAPVMVTTGAASSGGGIALKGDVGRFLMSLPEDGAITFRVADRQGEALEGRYDLPGIKALVARLAGPCKWRPN